MKKRVALAAAAGLIVSAISLSGCQNNKTAQQTQAASQEAADSGSSESTTPTTASKDALQLTFY